MNKLLATPPLVPSTRFAHTCTWTIDINDYGQKSYELYHVVSSTPKSVLVQRGTLFRGLPDVEGNALLDSICTASIEWETPLLFGFMSTRTSRSGARRLCRIGHRNAASLPQPGNVLE